MIWFVCGATYTKLWVLVAVVAEWSRMVLDGGQHGHS